MIYPDSATRKIYSKTKTIKHDLVQNNFLHGEGKLKGAWHIETMQKPYNQLVKNTGRRWESKYKLGRLW